MALHTAGLIVLFFLLLALIGVLCLIGLRLVARAWKSQYQAHLTGATAALRPAWQSVQDTSRALDAYPPDGPPPYGPSLANLRQAVADLKGWYPALSQRLKELRRPIPDLPPGRLRAVGFRLLLEPYYLWKASRRARDFRAWVAHFEDQAARAQQALGELRQLSLDVMARCTQVSAEIDRLGGVCAGLRAAGLHGTDLDRVAGVVSRLGESLSTLPECFSQPAQDQAPAAAAPDRLQQAWQVLDEVSAPLRLCAAQLDGWQGDLGRLRVSLEAVEALFRDVARAMSEAAQAAAFPLDWGRDEDELKRLSEAKARLGVAASPRTPERLAQDVGAAEALHADLQALSARAQQTCGQRSELLRLLEGLAVEGEPDWLDRAQTLQAEVEVYAAENWPDRLDAHRLGDDARSLRSVCRQCTEVDTGQTLSAEQVAEWLDQVRAVTEGIAGFPGLLDEVEARLNRLREEEQAALEQLQEAMPALERLLQSWRDAEPPLPPELDEHRQALERLHRHGTRLWAEFGQRRSGLVADKVQRLLGWNRSCLGSLRALQQPLDAEGVRLRTQLGNQVAELREIAPFDLEPSMGSAGELLSEPGSTAGPAAGIQGLATLANAYTEQLRAQRRLAAALQELRSRIVRLLERPREACRVAHAEAEARRLQVAALARSLAQGQPALACDTRPIDDLLRSAASAEERLRRSGRSVADVRRSLEEIAATYRQAVRALDELEGQIDQDRPRVQELWDQVERWGRQLAAYREQHADDPHAVQALDLRLGEIESGQAELERRWSRSAPTAGRARRDLEAFWYRVGGDVPLRGTGRVLRVREIQAGKRP